MSAFELAVMFVIAEQIVIVLGMVVLMADGRRMGKRLSFFEELWQVAQAKARQDEPDKLPPLPGRHRSNRQDDHPDQSGRVYRHRDQSVKDEDEAQVVSVEEEGHSHGGRLQRESVSDWGNPDDREF